MFAAAAAAAPRVRRLVYTSSVAAYGFHADNPQPLTENVPARGSDAHYYSAQKAELEATLFEQVAGSQLETYVLRPCIVAGPDALGMIEAIPWPVRRAPLTVLPDPGTRFQLVHHDDVASALVAAARGVGEPGIYNLAGPGELTAADLARELGWRRVPVPRATVSLAAAGAGLPLVPATRAVAERLPRAGADELRAGAQGAPLAPAPRRGLHAAGDRRGCPRARPRLVRGTEYRLSDWGLP